MFGRYRVRNRVAPLKGFQQARQSLAYVACLDWEASTRSAQIETLTVIIPGLRGVADLPSAGQPEPGSTALAQWLGRGVRVCDLPSGYERMLLTLAGYPVAPAEDAPVAAFARVGEGKAQQTGWWMRADPVHLRADRDQLILFPPAMLELTEAEAQGLTHDCNRLFAQDGWNLEALHPRRWYLHLDEDPELRTYDLDEAIGKAVADFLPRGAQRRRWQTLLTEVQMALHAAQVNSVRESQGQLMANSVWLWGSGPLPAAQPLPWQSVWAREPFAVGLARHSQVPCEVPGEIEPIIDAARRGPALLVWDGVRDVWARGDRTDYIAAVQAAYDGWITPVYEAVRDRRIESAVLATDGGLAFRLDKSMLRRFWRRGRLLSEAYATLVIGD